MHWCRHLAPLRVQNVSDCLSRDPMMVLHISFGRARTDEEMLFPKRWSSASGGRCAKSIPSMRICSSTLRSQVENLPSSPLNFQESLCSSVDRSCSGSTRMTCALTFTSSAPKARTT
jgi:hypothetical protein